MQKLILLYSKYLKYRGVVDILGVSIVDELLTFVSYEYLK